MEQIENSMGYWGKVYAILKTLNVITLRPLVGWGLAD